MIKLNISLRSALSASSRLLINSAYSRALVSMACFVFSHLEPKIPMIATVTGTTNTFDHSSTDCQSSFPSHEAESRLVLFVSWSASAIFIVSTVRYDRGQIRSRSHNARGHRMRIPLPVRYFQPEAGSGRGHQ